MQVAHTLICVVEWFINRVRDAHSMQHGHVLFDVQIDDATWTTHAGSSWNKTTAVWYVKAWLVTHEIHVAHADDAGHYNVACLVVSPDHVGCEFPHAAADAVRATVSSAQSSHATREQLARAFGARTRRASEALVLARHVSFENLSSICEHITPLLASVERCKHPPGWSYATATAQRAAFNLPAHEELVHLTLHRVRHRFNAWARACMRMGTVHVLADDATRDGTATAVLEAMAMSTFGVTYANVVVQKFSAACVPTGSCVIARYETVTRLTCEQRRVLDACIVFVLYDASSSSFVCRRRNEFSRCHNRVCRSAWLLAHEDPLVVDTIHNQYGSCFWLPFRAIAQNEVADVTAIHEWFSRPGPSRAISLCEAPPPPGSTLHQYIEPRHYSTSSESGNPDGYFRVQICRSLCYPRCDYPLRHAAETAQTGACVLVIAPHRSPVAILCYSTLGVHVWSANETQTLLNWNVSKWAIGLLKRDQLKNMKRMGLETARVLRAFVRSACDD